MALGYLELYFGKSFTGKTARMLHELRAVPRLLIVDPKCAQLAKLRGFDHIWPELCPRIANKPPTWCSGSPVDYFRTRRRRSEFRCVMHVRNDFRMQLEMLCKLLRKVRNLTLAVDELGLFIPSGAPSSLPPAITSAMISGRHEGLNFCGTAQRPALVHVTARSNAERIRWFRMTDAISVDAARDYMPDAMADTLPRLPDYVCIETTDKSPAFRDQSMVGKIKILGSRKS
jgi:hypothetical protein